ncbi:helix-turn-helix domain-containing protein [Rhizobium sp. TRM95111]|uniref:GlxA family transcriptional regulator n=1 Tax=Rhizobium alarense TaxID=2846851 RepID=UPI001F201917|nr:helix-turn-helix domain-containing protein [Rhizobium alarense]MCF3642798.1 helix-turn-helix domain-containing protein [Rhizobium alarense]
MTNAATGEPAEIGIVVHEEALMSAVYGLTDMFNVANLQSTEHHGKRAPQIRVSHWKLGADGSVTRGFDSHPSLPAAALSALILPPTLSVELQMKRDLREISAWLHQRHAEGTVVSSVCGGAYLLAESGLVKGRALTTHWSHAEQIARRFPEVQVDTDKLMIDEGDIITTGGMMAWINLGLKMVDRFMGSTVMLATARFMVVDPGAREQSYYSVFAPRMDHGDIVILKIQHWLHGISTKGITVEAMAGRAGLGERTFLRRFQKATGVNPTEYCQRLRIAKSRELLERSYLSIEQVAWQSGYDDSNAYRKIFRKILGISPSEYRMRFSIAGGRRPPEIEGAVPA